MRTLVVAVTALLVLSITSAAQAWDPHDDDPYGADDCPTPTLSECRNSFYRRGTCFPQHAGTCAALAACAAPTVAQCRDATFRESCGQPAEAPCAPYLQSDFQSGWNGDGAPQEPVLQPATMTDRRVSADDTAAAGRRVDAKVRHYDVRSMRSDQLPSSTFTGQRSLSVLAYNGLMRLSNPYIALAAPLDPWTMTDPMVTSCADYVTKKWFDYAFFEKKAARCGNDRECVYQAAIDPVSGLARPYLRKLDLTMEAMPAAYQLRRTPEGDPYDSFPRNAFYEVAPREILTLAAGWWTDAGRPELEALLAAADPVRTTIIEREFRFEWHRLMHDSWKTLGFTLEEEDDLNRRTGEYARLVVEYRTLLQLLGVTEAQKAIAATQGWSEALDMYSAHNQYNFERWRQIAALEAVINDMTIRLLAEWRHVRPSDGTVDQGCIGSSIACDWSPLAFKNEYSGLWQPEREADMARCNSLVDRPFSEIWWTGGAADVDAFDAWLVGREAERAALVGSLPWKPNHATGTDQRKTLRWGIPSIHEEHGQPNLLYAKYDQAAFIELGADAMGSPPRICSLTAAVFAELRAEVHWWDSSGPHTPEIVDFELSAGLERDRPMSDQDLEVSRTSLAGTDKVLDAYAHFEILGTVLFGFDEDLRPGETWDAVDWHHTFTAVDFRQPFAIGPIPAYARVLVTATPSLKTTVSIPAFAAGGQTCVAESGLNPVTHQVRADVLARAQIDAKGYLAIGIPGLSAGVKGTINVLDAQLPAMASLGVTSDTSRVYLTFDTWGELHTRLLGGSISAFAEALFLEWETEIYRWDPIKIDTDLWRYQVNLPLGEIASIFKKPAS